MDEEFSENKLGNVNIDNTLSYKQTSFLFNIFDYANTDFYFCNFHLSVCSNLLKQGLGGTVCHAQVFTRENEEKFGSMGYQVLHLYLICLSKIECSSYYTRV